jgi:hypothetical protein
MEQLMLFHPEIGFIAVWKSRKGMEDRVLPFGG